MRTARAPSSLIRGLLSTGLVAFGCNAIFGNEERELGENIGDGTSGTGGTETTAASAGTISGGNGGTGPDAGGAVGAAGAAHGGEAGADPASSTSDGPVTTSGSGGSGANTATSTSAASGSSGPCECTPGDSESKQEPCGNCGTATRTKLCGDDCRWGELGAQGECMNQGVCVPNEPGEELLHCERGRWRYRRSTCGSDCQWGPWTETACEGADVCDGCACIAWCTDPNTGGTTCKWIACSEAEARAECETDLTAPDVSCTRKEPFTFKEWLPD